ncbi:hypothetical protein LEP1GSC125_3492 [Leptospira mayottensis 200901122]|uniref:Uncharacterized protein n=1 Tax=Leptospira mayottensis 200901122 TaxID=1193010 RepID=A0AA87MMC4_9LEPT|nr:hypothetical protein LEP1GSC125_3492 [Leptospira mayottensis 200901122]
MDSRWCEKGSDVSVPEKYTDFICLFEFLFRDEKLSSRSFECKIGDSKVVRPEVAKITISGNSKEST